MVLVEVEELCIQPVQAGLRARLVARALSGRLDRQLADGALPESSVHLALRAQDLADPERRWALADALLVLVDAAGQGRTGPQESWPVRWRPVFAAAEELRALAQRLVAPGPVGVRGVALVQLLVSDGGGPLYYAAGPAELVGAVREAAAALELPEPAEPVPPS